MKPAVFIDRDGVLIKERHHLIRPEQVEIIKGAAAAIKSLNKKFPVFVISNQSVVARGLASEGDVRKINSEIQKALDVQAAKITEFYFCPHHPDFGVQCDCRKPGIGLLLKASKEHGIDLGRSYFIGDKTVDIKTGENAGTRTILVKTGYGGSDRAYTAEPDFLAKDLSDAARIILRDYAKARKAAKSAGKSA